jgi:hypothetical protein
VDKCPILAVALQDDATTLTAITAIGATEGYEFLTTEVARTGTTVTRTGKYLNVIYKVTSCHISNQISIFGHKGTKKSGNAKI